MAQNQHPDTKPCTHAGCRGTMHLRTGSDPTLRGTSVGTRAESVRYYECDADSEHFEVIGQLT